MNKVILFCIMIVSIQSFAQPTKTLIFEACVNGKKIVLNDSVYKNSFDEHYSISKLKYYVSDIHFTDSDTNTISNSVYLIDASKDNLIEVPFSSEKIKGISFLLGVDSIQNCSGAQSGALDPLNDMFWTWNNGYVMFKLEGKSVSSKADNQRIEHHIGGYKGVNKTMRNIFLPINEAYLKTHANITIQLNIDKYWKGINEIRIAETPVITTPGVLAKKVADNFKGMILINE